MAVIGYKSWFVIYTKPRWEKKVFDLLQTKGIEAYCPLNKVKKKWSDRFKIIEEPIFKSYVFVRVSEQEMSGVRFTNGVVNYVYWLGKPAKVQDEDIERIKRFLNEYQEVSVEKIISTKPGDKVLITGGLFMEQEGTILSMDNKRVEIVIETLGCKLIAKVDKERVVLKG